MSEVETTNKKSLISITSLGILFGMAISISYAFGYLYDQGYLSHYGLSNEYFTRTHQDYLFKFFYISIISVTGIFSIILDASLYALLLFLAISGLIFLLLQSKDKEVPKIFYKIIEWVKSRKIISNIIHSLWVTSKVFFGFIVVIYIIGILVIIPLLSLFKGINDAKKEISNYSECLEKIAQSHTCVFIYEVKSNRKKIILSGYPIAKSEKYIAVWNGENAKIHHLKNDEEIVIKKGTVIRKTK